MWLIGAERRQVRKPPKASSARVVSTKPERAGVADGGVGNDSRGSERRLSVLVLGVYCEGAGVVRDCAGNRAVLVLGPAGVGRVARAGGRYVPRPGGWN